MVHQSSVSSAGVYWEDIINRHEKVALHAITTRDFSVIKLLIAQSVASNAEDHSRVLLAVTGSDDTTTQLQDINTNTAQSSSTAVEDYQAAIDQQKQDKNTSASDWAAKLDDQQQVAINFATDKIKEATVKAKAMISDLPPAAQPAAANTYVAGTNYVMQAYDTLSTWIGNLGSSIMDFLKGIFQAVTNAVNAVKSAVSSAIASIKGFFSLVAQRPGTFPVSPGSSKFIGKLDWPATASVSTVTMGLAYVTRYLVDHDIRITLQTTTKEAESKATTTRTMIESKRAKRLANAGGIRNGTQEQGNSVESNGAINKDDSLKDIWQQAVDQLGKDGHYIPAE